MENRATERDPEAQRIRVVGNSASRRLLEAMLSRLRATSHAWRVNFTVTTGHNGTSVKVPIIYGRGFQNLKVGEPWLFKAFQRVLALRTGTFVDVGVNLGQTLIEVKLIDPDRPYIGFEPNPQCSQYASELIAANGFRECRLVPVGLSTAPRIVTLFAKTDAVDPSASIVPGFRAAARYQRTQDVPVFRGDDVLAELTDIAVLKVDVEGGELDVISGLQQTIARCQPYIFCEILPVFDAASQVGQFRKRRQDHLLQQLHALGYTVFRMLATGEAAELDDIEVHGDLSLTNYAFVPASELGRFRGAFTSVPRSFQR